MRRWAWALGVLLFFATFSSRAPTGFIGLVLALAPPPHITAPVPSAAAAAAGAALTAADRAAWPLVPEPKKRIEPVDPPELEPWCPAGVCPQCSEPVHRVGHEALPEQLDPGLCSCLTGAELAASDARMKARWEQEEEMTTARRYGRSIRAASLEDGLRYQRQQPPAARRPWWPPTMADAMFALFMLSVVIVWIWIIIGARWRKPQP